MASETEKRFEEVRKSLRRLDLYHHSLKLVGDKLVSEAAETPARTSDALHERSLQLSRDCTEVIQELCRLLDQDDVDACQSVLNQVDLAARRAAQAKTPTLHMVNIFRAIEASDQFLAGVAKKYGYERVFGETESEASDREDTKAAELAKLFAEYESAIATRSDGHKHLAPPFSHGVLRWRESALFYVETVEDGVRWIELDPDYEMQGVAEDSEEVEIFEARTIEGYPITLVLDATVDEDELESYILSQRGQEYFVSGFQVVREGDGKGSRTKRRR